MFSQEYKQVCGTIRLQLSNKRGVYMQMFSTNGDLNEKRKAI